MNADGIHVIERMITIAEEISRHFVPGERVAKLLHGLGGRRMLRDGDMHDAPAIMSREGPRRTVAGTSPSTTKKSAAISWCAWLVKNVRQVCKGSGRRRTMYLRLGPA